MAPAGDVDHALVMPGNAASLRALIRRIAGPKYPLPPIRLIRCQRCGMDRANPVDWHDHDDSTGTSMPACARSR
jgi:hypothetical protein